MMPPPMSRKSVFCVVSSLAQVAELTNNASVVSERIVLLNAGIIRILHSIDKQSAYMLTHFYVNLKPHSQF